MTQADLDKLLEDKDYQLAQQIAYKFQGMQTSYALKILDKARQMILEKSRVELPAVPIELAVYMPE